ncbi:MAG: AbrB/MazE/SpoVT family DNA-binding domain-containing protein [Candidatus Aenigmarchaeota archaeon]|nr:AbrB/MazE/SpoVT family DNA-binding domain-containing protein [Candidatus Aenigmarchaeota archaeon]
MPSSCCIQVTVDEKGRIVLPATIRRTLGLEKGEKLYLDMVISENIIVMRRGETYGRKT